MTVLGIHQPGYLPWMGFFKKMMNSEIFIFLDDSLFVKNNFYNRNKIKISSGPTLLTVPVFSHNDTLLKDVKIDNSKNWRKKHKKSILLNYSKANYFKDFSFFFENLFDKNFLYLIDLNMEIINFIVKQLDIKTKTSFSSELGISQNSSDRILEICKIVKADYYISGTTWARQHLKIDDFKRQKIDVEFQEFQHPEYSQIHGEFIPFMSVIDLLFNEGKENSKKILRESHIKQEIITQSKD